MSVSRQIARASRIQPLRAMTWVIVKFIVFSFNSIIWLRFTNAHELTTNKTDEIGTRAHTPVSRSPVDVQLVFGLLISRLLLQHPIPMLVSAVTSCVRHGHQSYDTQRSDGPLRSAHSLLITARWILLRLFNKVTAVSKPHNYCRKINLM